MSLHRYSIESFNLFRLNWLFLCIGLIFIATPLASVKIYAKNIRSYSFPKYFLLIFCFQASLYIISIGFSRLVGQLFPVFTSPHPDVILNAAHIPFWNTGFFPWGFYMIWIAVICYFIFCFQIKSHRKINFFLHCNTPLTKLGIHLSVSLSLGIASVCFTLQLCYFLLGIKPLMVTYGPNLLALISILVTILFVMWKNFKSLLFWLAKRYSPGLIWLSFLLFFTLLFIGINTLIIGSTHQTLTIPEWFSQWLQESHWKTVWIRLIESWWITVMPVTALFVARISNGYSLRTIMLTVLSFPIFISLILKTDIQWHIFSHEVLTASINILTLLGSIIFIYFALISRAWTRILFCREFQKSLRIKNKNYFPLLMKLRVIFFSIFYLVLMYGIYLVIFPAFIAAVLFLAIFLIMSVIFIYVCTVDYFMTIKSKKNKF
jgi:hypothetical protein